MNDKTVKKILGDLKEKSFEDLVEYVNGKGNDEEFIINIIFKGGDEDGKT